MRGPIAHNRESRSTLREPKTIWIKQGNLNSLKYWESKSIFWEPKTMGVKEYNLWSLKHLGVKDNT